MSKFQRKKKCLARWALLTGIVFDDSKLVELLGMPYQSQKKIVDSLGTLVRLRKEIQVTGNTSVPSEKIAESLETLFKPQQT